MGWAIGAAVMVAPINRKLNKMPANINAVCRYLAIDARLRKQPYPTLDDLKQAVEDRLSGKEVSLRTVQVDLQDMRQHSGLKLYAPIEYNRAHKNYSYTDQHYSIIHQLFHA